MNRDVALHSLTLATSDGIWDRQGDAEEIAVGGKTVYHEAQPREWVSYLLAARKKGLTGYQFRAPAEWFAELYAAYKSKMLGPSAGDFCGGGDPPDLTPVLRPPPAGLGDA